MAAFTAFIAFFSCSCSHHILEELLWKAFKKGEVQTARANDRWSEISIAPLSQHSCSAPQGLSRRSPARRNFKEQLQETDDLHSTESQLSHVFFWNVLNLWNIKKTNLSHKVFECFWAKKHAGMGQFSNGVNSYSSNRTWPHWKNTHPICRYKKGSVGFKVVNWQSTKP